MADQLERPADEDEITEPEHYTTAQPQFEVTDSRAHEVSDDPDDD